MWQEKFDSTFETLISDLKYLELEKRVKVAYILFELKKDIFNITEKKEKCSIHVTNELKDKNKVLSLFKDIKNYVSAQNYKVTILPADNPIKLKLGWICVETNKYWSIRIGDFKRGLSQMTGEEQEFFRAGIFNHEDKLKLAVYLSQRD